mmetsp:Transcript_22682/g.63499  ORF Transcript_22682/g.63499 Transcript_22682/m.63499 type:complete len:214 (+) Transcript_22682:581-1222(+)
MLGRRRAGPDGPGRLRWQPMWRRAGRNGRQHQRRRLRHLRQARGAQKREPPQLRGARRRVGEVLGGERQRSPRVRRHGGPRPAPRKHGRGQLAEGRPRSEFPGAARGLRAAHVRGAQRRPGKVLRPQRQWHARDRGRERGPVGGRARRDGIGLADRPDDGAHEHDDREHHDGDRDRHAHDHDDRDRHDGDDGRGPDRRHIWQRHGHHDDDHRR